MGEGVMGVSPKTRIERVFYPKGEELNCTSEKNLVVV